MGAAQNGHAARRESSRRLRSDRTREGQALVLSFGSPLAAIPAFVARAAAAAKVGSSLSRGRDDGANGLRASRWNMLSM
jgi:hypothetical protein